MRTRPQVIACFTNGAIEVRSFFTDSAMRRWINRQKAKDSRVEITIVCDDGQE